MSAPGFVLPDAGYRDSFVAAMAEFAAEGRGAPHDNSTIGEELRTRAGQWSTPEGFRRYVAEVLAQATEAPEGWVCASSRWWVEGPQYLGRLAIRHELTPGLLEVGGHIGYDVRVSARRRGHATAMLAAALPLAAGLGIDPALVTCDVDNVASRKVIEANGGVLEDQRYLKLRFWVPTRTAG